MDKDKEKELKYVDTPRSLMLEKVIMGELLNVNDMTELMKCTLDEFKRTFSCPNKDIEIVFREITNKNISKGDSRDE